MTEEREKYLESLAYDYDVKLEIVYGLAEILGETEDYDALITELRDISDQYHNAESINY